MISLVSLLMREMVPVGRVVSPQTITLVATFLLSLFQTSGRIMTATRLTRRSAKLPSPPKATGRPTRKAAVAATTAIIESDKGSMKLHVRTPPSRLAEVTGGSNRPSRGSRKRAIVEESSDEDDDAEGEDEDEDEEMVDAEDDEEEDEDAEGEEDEEMEGLPPPPPVKPKATSKSTSTTSKPVAKPAAPPPRITKAAISAAIKEKDESDDDELSSLGSLEEEEEDEDAEGEDDMDETNANINDDGEEEEDAEGEIDDEMAGVDSDGIPFDDEDTPDLSRLTRRQRAVHDLEDFDESLVSLSNEAQKKKHLTAEEYAMRRAEMARRRKTLSEKRNEEEKVCLNTSHHRKVDNS